jgi:hypothetical protein
MVLLPCVIPHLLSDGGQICLLFVLVDSCGQRKQEAHAGGSMTRGGVDELGSMDAMS